jgi:hypothetical protein
MSSIRKEAGLAGGDAGSKGRGNNGCVGVVVAAVATIEPWEVVGFTFAAGRRRAKKGAPQAWQQTRQNWFAWHWV